MTRSQRWTMLAVVLGSGIVFLDSTLVSVALPRIAADLPRTFLRVLEGQSYVYNGYLLSLSALLILAGALVDFYGRRKMFVIGLAGFGLTSLLCGLAWNLEVLVLFRILQGAAGAILVPCSLSIIREAFDGPAQGRAFGIWAGASGATIILGPLVGGLFVDTLSWRAAFFINVPLVLLALVATLNHVEESRDEEASSRFDWLGAALVVLGVGGLSFGVIRGQDRQWDSMAAFIALAIGAVATIVFPFVMRLRKNPLVPLNLFKSRNFTVTNISTFLIYGALYVQSYFIAIFVQGTLGYNAAAVGLAFIPGAIWLVLFSAKFGAMAAKRGPRIFMVAGPIIMALGLLLIARVPADSSPWEAKPTDLSTFLPPADFLTDLLPGQVLFGIGLMVLVAPLTTALMTSVSARRGGIASAINNAISRVGPQLAGAAIFAAITASFYAGMADRVPGLDPADPQLREAVAPLNSPQEGVRPAVAQAAKEASTDAFHIAMWVSSGLLLAGAVANLWIKDEQALESEGAAPPTTA